MPSGWVDHSVNHHLSCNSWPEGSHCRDFFFLDEEAIGRVHAVTVDVVTNAPDHQPLMLDL